MDEIEVTSRSVVVRRAHCAQHEIELVEPPAVWVATEVGVAIGDHLGDLRVGESLRRQTRPERPQRRQPTVAADQVVPAAIEELDAARVDAYGRHP